MEGAFIVIVPPSNCDFLLITASSLSHSLLRNCLHASLPYITPYAGVSTSSLFSNSLLVHAHLLCIEHASFSCLCTCKHVSSLLGSPPLNWSASLRNLFNATYPMRLLPYVCMPPLCDSSLFVCASLLSMPPLSAQVRVPPPYHLKGLSLKVFVCHFHLQVSACPIRL